MSAVKGELSAKVLFLCKGLTCKVRDCNSLKHFKMLFLKIVHRFSPILWSQHFKSKHRLLHPPWVYLFYWVCRFTSSHLEPIHETFVGHFRTIFKELVVGKDRIKIQFDFRKYLSGSSLPPLMLLNAFTHLDFMPTWFWPPLPEDNFRSLIPPGGSRPAPGCSLLAAGLGPEL